MSLETPEKMNADAPSALRIRDGTVDDAERIEAVHYESREAAYANRISEWPPAGPDRPGRIARWERWLADPGITCLVGEIDGELVGFCTVRASHDPDADGADMAEMPTLYVRPGAWHRGHGRALCEAGIGRAVSLGFRSMTLWVLEINKRACAFYEAFGFEPDGVTKIDMSSRDALVARRYRISL